MALAGQITFAQSKRLNFMLLYATTVISFAYIHRSSRNFSSFVVMRCNLWEALLSLYNFCITKQVLETLNTSIFFSMIDCSTGNDSWLVNVSVSYNTTITSPNYPLDYSDNMECTWQVQNEDKVGGYVLKVLINGFELQQDQALSLSRCPFDNLTFYDGMSDSSLFLESFCGTVHPEVIYSSGKNLFIKFHTDSEMTFRGLNISVLVVEAGTE